MFACFDDEGRFYVAESSGKDLYAGLKQLTRDCRVSRLEDSDGDGRYDKRSVFEENVTFPMGLAWRGGKLYIADSPARVSLLESWRRNNVNALQRLNGFKPLLMGGDPERGRELFATATCSGCHRIGERGGVVGPDLTKIGAIRSGNDLLESILYPSRSFAQGYEPYNLTLRNGEELSGSLAGQGADGVSLRDGTGAMRFVRGSDIATLARQETSAMPEGLEQLMSRAQFRDLLAYLQSLK